MDYQDFFRGKKITMMGLGLLGRGINDAKFLAECGADLLVTDLKKAEDLKEATEALKNYPNIVYHLGEHRLEDFRDRDMVIKAAGVPLDSIYIAEARQNNIPVYMDEALFMKLAPEVKIIGVTGTRGKTTTTYLIYEILKRAFPGRVYLGGNIKGVATLPFLSQVKAGDIMVLELSSWQLQGFHDLGLSPHISVFTNFLDDHLNYYKGDVQAYFDDKAHIFRHQTKPDYLVATDELMPIIHGRYAEEILSQVIIPHDDLNGWKLQIPGQHNAMHVRQALAVGRLLGVTEEMMRKTTEAFGGVEGRMEFIKEYQGVKIYNDTTATTPDATKVALEALGTKQNIVLIMGGFDKGLDMNMLVEPIQTKCKMVVMLPGTGSDKFIATYPELAPLIVQTTSLVDAVETALTLVATGDILLLSPAFASFGLFKNEYDRGEQFNDIVQGLK